MTESTRRLLAAAAAALGVAVCLAEGGCGPQSRLAAAECAALALMRTYAGAQINFHKADYDGDGVLEYCGPSNKEAPSFTALYSTTVNGQRIELIDEAFAKADLASPNPAPKWGYLFADIPCDAKGEPYDARFSYGFCAVPARYGVSTRFTFILDIQGTLLRKDTGGHPIIQFPANWANEGWKDSIEPGAE